MMLANGVYAICQWGMLIVLAKLGSPDIVGHFAMAVAITAPIILIANMQLRGVQATDAKKEYFISDYLAVRMISTMVALIITVLIVSFGRFSPMAFVVTIILALAKSVESLSDVFYGFFQQHEHMKYMAISMVLKGLLSVSVLGGIYYYSTNLPWALIGLCISWLAVLIFYDLGRARSLAKTIEGEAHSSLFRSALVSIFKRREIIARIIVLAFPLGVVMGIISLNANLPRYAIGKFLGAHELGVFAALVYTTVAISMFIQSLGQAMAPKMARHFAAKNIPAFKAILHKMIGINILIGVSGVSVILIGGRWLLSTIYTVEYAGYSHLFMALMVCAAAMGVASAYGYAMTATRQFKLQVPLFLAVLTSTALISYFCIPHSQLLGAALALFVSALVQIVGSALIVQGEINRNMGRSFSHAAA